jgi:hypothetical protein
MKGVPTLAGVPVVLMGWPDEEPGARAAGCDGFLSKPVSMSDLLNSLICGKAVRAVTHRTGAGHCS